MAIQVQLHGMLVEQELKPVGLLDVGTGLHGLRDVGQQGFGVGGVGGVGHA